MQMSTPAAKRRRVEAASKTLARPFRSPLKTPNISPVRSSDQTSDAVQVSEKDKSSQDATSPRVGTISSLQSSMPVTKTRYPQKIPQGCKGQLLSPASGRNRVLDSQDPEIASLISTQRVLEKQLQELKNDLETAKQAKKIESESRLKHPGDEIDQELVELIAKWRLASRQAAEELFGLARDRVNRMGGPKAWKESQKKQKEFHDSWNDGDQLKSLDNAAEEQANERPHIYEDYDIDPETDIKRAQHIDKIDENGQEDEFTLGMMLRTLNIDLTAIGYDKAQHAWMD
ncbi:hypothetical protein F5884DRAFT_788057 [Xylogone sp. PMI_703]|nr:hypothetical protein F5884DRAFT_788057 [Xylogone sp. PMI_703]